MRTTVLFNSHMVRILVVTAALLLIPLITMQFNDQVRWTGVDFAVAAVLLLAAGVVLDLIVTKVHGKYRKIIGLGLLAVVFGYIWAELAVGVFTSIGS